MAHWLYKSEPEKWSWEQQVAAGEKGTYWDGVRNHSAKLNLMAMKRGDRGFFYHSNEGKEIVGVARVTKEAYQDPTTDGDWSSVEIAPVKKLRNPVTLATIKAHPLLSKMALVKRSRISVVPVTRAELAAVLKLADTTL